MTAEDHVEHLGALVDVARKATKAYERDDLDERLVSLRELVRNPGIHVVVCGEFKQGKSSLVNALVGADVCPVDDDVATAVPTFVAWGDEPGAFVTPSSNGAEAATRTIDLDDVRDVVVEHRGQGIPEVVRVRIGLPEPLLQDGLVLVDTPGVGGLGSVHAMATLAALPFAEAMVFVSDASQEYTEAELAFLRQARQLCDRLVCVVTKIDLYPEWRRVVEADEEHLRREGIEAPILVTSAALHAAGRRDGDAELLDESRLARLHEHLSETISDRAVQALIAESARELASIVRLIAMPFEAAAEALGDPKAAEAAAQRLAEAKRRAEELRQDAARWSTSLTDGIADLRNDVLHDLRSRLRTTLAEADATIEASDPGAEWDEIDRRIRAGVFQEVIANYATLRDRASQVSAAVAAHFREEAGPAFTETDAFDPVPILEGLGPSASPEFNDRGRAAKVISVARGANTGAFMFRSAAGMIFAGLSPLGVPVMAATVGVALLMGRKTWSDERARELTQARAQAKTAVRKYVDDLQFTINKHVQDSIIELQRGLRDHYDERSRELVRSTDAAVKEAQRIAQGTEAARAKRLQKVQTELQRIGQVEADVRRLSEVVAAELAEAQA